MESIIELLKTIILGVVQGITEWLPISSTGHMLLVDELLHLNVSEKFKATFMVVVQLGSILAVVVLYFHKLNPFSPSKNRIEKRETMSLWMKVIVATVPVVIVGLLIEDQIDALFYNYQTIAIALIVYGVLFLVIENRNKTHYPTMTTFTDVSYTKAFFIGMFQMLALIPGTSRSGSTILGASLLGTSREIAAEFSFFMAIPAMFGASFLKLLKAGFSFTSGELVVLITGSLVAFIVSIIAIRFLMSYIKKKDFKIFGYYRIVLGIVVLLFFTFVK